MFDLLKSDVPIIGQPFKAYAGGASAIVTCLCQPDPLPMPIRGVDLAVQCVSCGKAYGILKVEFDRAQGHTQPMVTVVYLGGPAN